MAIEAVDRQDNYTQYHVMLIDPSARSFYYDAVFGWFQDSFTGIERESPYNLSVGYLKGAEQADTSAALILNVIMKFMRKQPCTYNIINSSTCIQVPNGNRTHILWTRQLRCDDLPIIIIELPCQILWSNVVGSRTSSWCPFATLDRRGKRYSLFRFI